MGDKWAGYDTIEMKPNPSTANLVLAINRAWEAVIWVRDHRPDDEIIAMAADQAGNYLDTILEKLGDDD